MFRIFKIFLGACALLTMSVVVTSCGEGYLDINSSPNNPDLSATVPSSVVMPVAQLTWGYELAGWLNRYTSLNAQLWASNGGQFRNQDRYLYVVGDFNNSWTQVYAGVITDLRQVRQLSIPEPGGVNIAAAAKVLEAHAIVTFSDLFGDIPYSEAFQAAANLAPAYDTQASIYDAAFDLIDEALAEFDNTAGYNTAGEFIYPISANGNPGTGSATNTVNNYIRFANSLKLRMYMRLSERDPARASAGIAGIFNSGALIISSNAQNAQVPFFANPQDENPVAFWTGSRPGDYAGSAALIDTMKLRVDPRLANYFNFGPGNGGVRPTVHTGNINGVAATAAVANNFSRVGSSTERTSFNSQTAPALLITYSEVQFILAEAAVRGWIAGSAQTFYENGIRASMQRLTVPSTIPTATIDAYIAQPSVAFPSSGTTTQQLRAIWREKWVSLFGQGTEAWSEYRRNNYPVLTAATQSNGAPGTFIPGRYLYPTNELNLNNANVTAANLALPNQANLLNNRVWWDNN